MTTQLRSSNPLKESAMDTSEVLTMVVSSVDKNKVIHIPAVSIYKRHPFMYSGLSSSVVMCSAVTFVTEVSFLVGSGALAAGCSRGGGISWSRAVVSSLSANDFSISVPPDRQAR